MICIIGFWTIDDIVQILALKVNDQFFIVGYPVCLLAIEAFRRLDFDMRENGHVVLGFALGVLCVLCVLS